MLGPGFKLSHPQALVITYGGAGLVATLYILFAFNNYVLIVYFGKYLFLLFTFFLAFPVFYVLTSKNAIRFMAYSSVLLANFAVWAIIGFLLLMGSCTDAKVNEEFLSPDKSRKIVIYQQGCGFGDQEFTVATLPTGLGVPNTIISCEDCFPTFLKWHDKETVLFRFQGPSDCKANINRHYRNESEMQCVHKYK